MPPCQGSDHPPRSVCQKHPLAGQSLQDSVIAPVFLFVSQITAVQTPYPHEFIILETLKVTPFGTLHTGIGLVALVAGLIALLRQKEISPKLLAGKIYMAATILTCLTGFG